MSHMKDFLSYFVFTFKNKNKTNDDFKPFSKMDFQNTKRVSPFSGKRIIARMQCLQNDDFVGDRFRGSSLNMSRGKHVI